MPKVTNTSDRRQYVMLTNKKRVMLEPNSEPQELDIADVKQNRALIHVGSIRIGDKPAKAAAPAATLNSTEPAAPRETRKRT